MTTGADPFAGRLTVRPCEAAAALGISRSTVHELVRSGRLRAVILGESGQIRTKKGIVRKRRRLVLIPVDELLRLVAGR